MLPGPFLFGLLSVKSVHRPMSATTPVQKELIRIASDYRRFHLFKGLCLVLGIHLIFALLLFPLERFAGFASPLAPRLLAISAFIATVILWWNVSRQPSDLIAIARRIERQDPKLNSLLLAAAEQSPHPETGQLNFLQQKVIGD